MKYLKYILVMIFGLLCFQCATKLALEKKAPTTFKAVYFQSWNSGLENGGSGTTLHIETADTLVAFDSVYFRGHKVKLLVNASNPFLYTATVKYENKKTSIQSRPEDSMYKLKDNEAVISYTSGTTKRYYKIENIIERPSLNYPITSQNR